MAVNAHQDFTHSCVQYLKLTTGESFWYCDTQWDGYTVTKIGRINVSDYLQVPVFNQGKVVLLHTQGPWPAKWSTTIPHYEYYEHTYLGFAFSEQSGASIGSANLMPWSTGGFPNHYYMRKFGLHGEDGSVIFNATRHCSNSSAIMSPPALDYKGFVYYKQVVSLYINNGKLCWRSKEVTQDYKLASTDPITAHQEQSPLLCEYHGDNFRAVDGGWE